MEDQADVRQLDPVPQLVAEAKRGDRDAFGQLYRLHHASVARVARFRLGSSDADDAVSEVFLRAWKALPNYRDTGAPFSAWLYGITRHVVTDELRRRGRTEPHAEVPDQGHEPLHEQHMDLAAAIERLPLEQRQVIELKFLVGLKNPEVATAMDSTPGAVNSRQWRALESLRTYLSPVEESS